MTVEEAFEHDAEMLRKDWERIEKDWPKQNAESSLTDEEIEDLKKRYRNTIPDIPGKK